MQTAFFVWIWNSAAPIHKADLIVVFPGDEERIAEGHALAKAGYAANLLIVGQTKMSHPVEPGILRDHSRKVRIYCNEMIKLWGSAAEMLGCRITDSLLRDSPFLPKSVYLQKTDFFLRYEMI